MQIELIENPLLGLHHDQGCQRTVGDYSENDQTRSTEEQNRLLLSWRTVLGEIGSSGRGAGQW